MYIIPGEQDFSGTLVMEGKRGVEVEYSSKFEDPKVSVIFYLSGYMSILNLIREFMV